MVGANRGSAPHRRRRRTPAGRVVRRRKRNASGRTCSAP